MQATLNSYRILIFAASLTCLAIDAFFISVEGQFETDSRLIYYCFTDIFSIVINGYYFIVLERKWDKPPTTFDCIIYFLEFLFWTISVIIKATSNQIISPGPSILIVTIVLGGIILLLSIIFAISLSWWAGRLSQATIIPISTPLNINNANNPGTEMNNAGSEFLRS
ncbi:hypothetical protein C1645_840516 [Glomus cerebriforme]|uniref:MARVEL domain-containing protein n=1 Tax=Glomus cerebriforme TaxID=658196 RepID=A0A397RZB3_9GLOM|nr:hypothetical protein C1645_840516 [Glomus cerebriforme]